MKHSITLADSSSRQRAKFSGITLLIVGLLWAATGTLAAGQTLSVSPTSLSSPNVLVGTTGPSMYVTLTNTGTTRVTISAVAITPTEFSLVSGSAVTIRPGATYRYAVRFTPDAVQTFSGQLILTISGAPSITIPLTGAGYIPLSITPSSGNFGLITVGKTSAIIKFTATNTGTTTIKLTAVSVAPAEFELTAGGPVGLQPGSSTHFQIQFAPDAQQSFSGQLAVTVGTSTIPIVIPLTGSGVTTSATVSVLPTSLAFSNQPVGSNSAVQSVTVTNTGAANVTLQPYYVTPPFLVTGPAPVSLAPGQSTALNVSLFGTLPGSYTGTLNIPFDVLNPIGVSLSGNTVAATSLAISTYPNLPLATLHSPYLASLLASGGLAPYTWTLQAGSSLPLGLNLSSAGSISGTLDSSVKAGNYSFTVQVTDSSGSSASAALVLGAGALTGANCNDITFNVPETTTPLIPLTDLGSGTYLDEYVGGLYANGSNLRPPDHDADGVARALAIQPLDSGGNASSSGAYALVSIGPSDTQQEFVELMQLANADPAKNSHLVLVNTAQPGATARYWTDPNSTYWKTAINNILPAQNISPQQVAAAWVQAVNVGTIVGTYPGDMDDSQADMETIAQVLLTKFPNIQVVYYTSRIYGGYGNGVNTFEPEQYAYDTGWAVKAVILDQINGAASLNYDASKGPVVAPWIAWGPYYWANGLLARNDGLTWSCQELKHDGLHPQDPLGRQKVAASLLDFLKTDTTAAPWFLAPASPK